MAYPAYAGWAVAQYALRASTPGRREASKADGNDSSFHTCLHLSHNACLLLRDFDPYATGGYNISKPERLYSGPRFCQISCSAQVQAIFPCSAWTAKSRPCEITSTAPVPAAPRQRRSEE